MIILLASEAGQAWIHSSRYLWHTIATHDVRPDAVVYAIINSDVSYSPAYTPPSFTDSIKLLHSCSTLVRKTQGVVHDSSLIVLVYTLRYMYIDHKQVSVYITQLLLDMWNLIMALY